MKIAILTLPVIRSNYGNILQAWALQAILEEMGHSVEVLMPKRYKKLPLRQRVKNIILKIKERRKEDNFKAKNIKMRWVNGLSPDAVNGYDAIVVGSDQVWRKSYFEGCWRPTDPENAFLAFCSNLNIRRIVYAASLGLDYWEYNSDETTRIKQALDSAHAISVREISAVDILNEATECKAVHVLDPTMLISKDRYLMMAKDELTKVNRVIASYILDDSEDKKVLINKVSTLHNLPNTELNEPSVSIKKWIASIASSEMVITDSFHGCVFAIIFNKPLVFLSNANRGNARFDSLINTFGISKNQVTSSQDFDEHKDYSLPTNLNNILDTLRLKSLNFLENSLQQ